MVVVDLLEISERDAAIGVTTPPSGSGFWRFSQSQQSPRMYFWLPHGALFDSGVFLRCFSDARRRFRADGGGRFCRAVCLTQHTVP